MVSCVVWSMYLFLPFLQAVKLESIVPSRVRYMAVVSTMGRQDTEESVILGIDIVNQRSTIGMVLPVWSGTLIRLDGDG